MPLAVEVVSDTICVAIFDNSHKAANAVRALVANELPLESVSIVGRHQLIDADPAAFERVASPIRYSDVPEPSIGGPLRFIFAPTVFVIPGVGPVMSGGPLTDALMAAVVGTAARAPQVPGGSILEAGLVSIGVPSHIVMRYRSDIKLGRFVVIAHVKGDVCEDLYEHLDEAQRISMFPRSVVGGQN